jgi:pyrroloquinoline quinone (PQQ) biosynthesis protein C
MAKALQENYGFSDQAVRWFTMHAELDAEHGEEFHKYAARVAEQPGGLERLREKTRAFAQVAKNVRNGFGVWQ